MTVVVLVVLLILILCSIQTVAVGHWGLDMNYVTNEVDVSRVYPEGVYVIGLGHSMIQYPRFLQIIDYSQLAQTQLDVHSLDGQALSVDISVWFQYNGSEVGGLFTMFGLDSPVDSLTAVALAEAQAVCSSFRATEFFTDRTNIRDSILHHTNAAMQRMHANAVFVQLRRVDVSAGLDAAIVQVEVARQDVEMQKSANDAARNRAQISVINATASAHITQINAEAEASALIISKTAEGNVTGLTLNADKEIAYTMINSLGWSTQQLLDFWYIQALQTQGAGAEVFVGLKSQIIHA